jgi:hypothetical protein
MALFLRNFECGASWTAVALYLPPKAELFFAQLLGGRSDEQAHSGEGQEKAVSRPRAAADSQTRFPKLGSAA